MAPPARPEAPVGLQVSELRVSYQGVRALDGVHLTVRPGQIVALVGGNGNGKSTTLRAIAGLNALDGGSVRFGGCELADVPAHRRVALGVSLVPEGRRLFGRLTVRRNLELGAYTRSGAHELAQSVDEMYTRLVSTWSEPERLVRGGREPQLPWQAVKANLQVPADRMMLFDLLGYLPDDILTKVDRASMGNSLEVRAPLLDHRVVEFAWRLPLRQKIRGGESKWLLRRVLERHVPRPLFERPKAGFGVPIDTWLRGPLREWAEDQLSEERLVREGFFDPAQVRSALTEHLNGTRNRQYQLWSVLMFESWLDLHSGSERPA